MARYVLSGKFDKPAGFKLKAGATGGSANINDYELVTPDKFTAGSDREDVVVFPPITATTRSGANSLRFQGGGNGDPFVFRIAYKTDDGSWKLAPVRVFQGFGTTLNDATNMPAGTVAVSIIRMDAGRGAVGYVLDLEI